MGNGKSIRIWKDKWLPIPSSYKVTSPMSIFHEEARVEELIDANSGSWKQEILSQVFLPHEAEIIGGITLSSNLQNDRQIWAPIATGLFSVRSAYWVAKEEAVTGGRAGVSNDSSERKFWKYLCSMNLPHKVRHFAWRACKDILPTKENLERRKVLVDSCCEVCQTDVESLGHMF